MNPDHKNNYIPKSLTGEPDYLKVVQDQRDDLRYALRQIISMLPTNRDWLDPDIEKYARRLLDN